MLGSEIRKHLASGGKVFGTMMENPANPKQLGFFLATGIDFVFIDNEHQPLGREVTAQACQFFASNNIAAVVRIPKADPAAACMSIDGGAQGIIAPYVECDRQVWDIICAVKYRPLKGKSLTLLRETGRFPSPETERYLLAMNRHHLVIIMIESREGIDRLDGLLAFREVDAVLIGPNDLSISLGVPDGYDSPLFRDAVTEVMRKSRQAGKGFGLHFDEFQHNEYWVERGANFTVFSRDTFGACQYLRTGIERLRKRRGAAVGA
jgi:4-hydroxy-2-oxoheptanedioate aldolase